MTALVHETSEVSYLHFLSPPGLPSWLTSFTSTIWSKVLLIRLREHLEAKPCVVLVPILTGDDVSRSEINSFAFMK